MKHIHLAHRVGCHFWFGWVATLGLEAAHAGLVPPADHLPHQEGLRGGKSGYIYVWLWGEIWLYICLVVGSDKVVVSLGSRSDSTSNISREAQSAHFHHGPTCMRMLRNTQRIPLGHFGLTAHCSFSSAISKQGKTYEQKMYVKIIQPKPKAADTPTKQD